jgi:DNA-binding PadR family transcriptional regulator
MSLDHILLGLLQRPASGYDLKAQFEEGARYVWSAELSQIYPALQKMQRRGWLRSRTVKSTKGPPRRVYERTPRGDAALHKWLRGEPILGTERFAYLAQLLFLGELGDLSQTLSFLQQLRAKLAAYARFLEGASAETLAGASPEELAEPAFHDWIAMQLGVKSLQAKVAWCDEAIGLIEKRLQREKSHV